MRWAYCKYGSRLVFGLHTNIEESAWWTQDRRLCCCFLFFCISGFSWLDSINEYRRWTDGLGVFANYRTFVWRAFFVVTEYLKDSGILGMGPKLIQELATFHHLFWLAGAHLAASCSRKADRLAGWIALFCDVFWHGFRLHSIFPSSEKMRLSLINNSHTTSSWKTLNANHHLRIAFLLI